MGAKKPGPLCSTSAPRRDHGTSCLNQTPPPGPNRAARPAEPRLPELRFNSLWQGYPSGTPYVDKSGDAPPGFDNQCAIKVSVALHEAGFDMRDYKGAFVLINGKRAAIRAEELAGWLKTQHIMGLPSRPENVTGSDWQSKINDRTGIAFFANYWPREGEKHPTGDHIDLWNGSRLTASGFWGTAVTVARFRLGYESGPGFHDLGKATTILFWDVR